MIYVQLQISCILPMYKPNISIKCTKTENKNRINQQYIVEKKGFFFNHLKWCQHFFFKSILFDLKRGCTRFEVEHISCSLLLNIGKTL